MLVIEVNYIAIGKSLFAKGPEINLASCCPQGMIKIFQTIWDDFDMKQNQLLILESLLLKI